MEAAIRRSPTRGDQVKNFGSGAHPFGPNGPVVQFGAQRGPVNPFGRFQSNNYNNPPPEPYARPLGNSNYESLARTYVFCSDRLRFT